MNYYLPLNKFFARSEEMGETRVVNNISDEIIDDFINDCYFSAEYNPYVSVWGVSRSLKGDELISLLEKEDELSYSYYDKSMKRRITRNAYSFNEYANLRPEGSYQVEVNISDDSFTIYRVD